jgi:hypothetical protein
MLLYFLIHIETGTPMKGRVLLCSGLPAELIDVEQAKKIVGGNKLNTKFDKVFLSVSTVETL